MGVVAMLVPLLSDGWRPGPAVAVADGGDANGALARIEADGAERLAVVLTRDPDWSTARLVDVVEASVASPVIRGLSAAGGLAVVAGSVRGDASSPTVVVASVETMVAIGGFDPDEPGLGWLDLVDRMAASGRSVVGVDLSRLPFAPALTAHLLPVDRIEAEGRWFERRGRGARARARSWWHRRRVLVQVGRARSRGPEFEDPGFEGRGFEGMSPEALDRLDAGARRRWRGRRPDQAQQGTGRRADWRHLIGPRRRGSESTTMLLGLGPTDEWTWLVDDGWTGRVITDVPRPAVGPIDVLVIGPAGPAPGSDAFERARSTLGEQGSLVVFVAGRRRPGRSRAVVRALAQTGHAADQDGDHSVRRHLVLPDAGRPKRFVPLEHPGGPAWLAGPTPRLAAARLPLHRRSLRALAARAAVWMPELLGDVAVVRGPASDHGPAVVLTSGFDEGSRTVVLPFGHDGRPTSVVKATSRPAYVINARREHELLGRLAPLVRPAGLVPAPIRRFEIGGVPAVAETYAGRWTATDVLEEQGSLPARVALLHEVVDAIGNLAKTGRRVETWNADGFDDLVGRWFDRLDEADGPSPVRAALRRDLADRSAELEGLGLPIGLRHFDLGPWNVVLADAGSVAGRGLPPGSPEASVTVVDWELAEPRQEPVGPIGADLLYFTKYWLHIAIGCRSIDDEQAAFAFLPADAPDPRHEAKAAIARSTAALGVPIGFLPLLEANVWAEAAAYTRARRRQRGGDGGSPARYLDTVARHRSALLSSWPT